MLTTPAKTVSAEAVSIASTVPASAAPDVATAAPGKTMKAVAAPKKKAAPKAKPVKAAKPIQPAKAAATAKPVPLKTAKPAAAPKTTAKAAATKKPVATKAKIEKPLKLKKPKLVRDSFTIPKTEYVVLETLKQRAIQLAQPAKKSELLRAGIKALAALSDADLRAALQAVPAIKTGRPASAKAA